MTIPEVSPAMPVTIPAIAGIDQWPNISVTYYFKGILLGIDFEFDHTVYKPHIPDRTNNSARKSDTASDTYTWQQQAVKDRNTYADIIEQLQRTTAYNVMHDGVKTKDLCFTVSTNLTPAIPYTLPETLQNIIISFVSDIHVYLCRLIDGIEIWDEDRRPEIKTPLTVTMDTDKLNPAYLFELEVFFNVDSSVTWAHDGRLGDMGQCRAATMIYACKPETFAIEFEKAFAGETVWLKLLTPKDKPGNKKVWIARWGLTPEAKGISFSLGTGQASMFAVRPADTQLRNIHSQLYPYKTGEGITWNEKDAGSYNFSDIYTGDWIQQFTNAFDELSGKMDAVALISELYKDDIAHNPGREDILRSIDKNRERLARSLSRYLTPFSPGQKGNVTGAQQYLRQLLQAQLSTCYSTTTVQTPATVSAYWNNENPNDYRTLHGYVTGIRAATSNSNEKEGFRFATGAIVLQPGTKVASDLNFVLSMQSPEMQTHIALNNLHYQPAYLTCPGTSDELYFVIQPEGMPLPFSTSPDIPVAYRKYPPAIRITGLGASAMHSQDTTLANATLWNFCFSYSKDRAAQDVTYCEVIFNQPGEDKTLQPLVKEPDNNDLLAALAQFVFVYPAMWQDITKSLAKTTEKTGIDSPEYKVAMPALKSFSQLATHIAEALEDAVLKTAALDQTLPDQAHAFHITEKPEHYSSLPEQSRLIVTVTISKEWPEDISTPYVAIEGYIHELIGEPVKIDGANNYCYCYHTTGHDEQYLTYQAAFNMLTRTVCIAGLNALQFQNATARAGTIRNSELVKDADGKWQHTPDPFVYKTPLSIPPSAIVPQLHYSTPVRITQKPAALREHILSLLTSVLGQNIPFDISLKTAVQYGYTLQPGVTDMETHMPVILMPPITIAAGASPDITGIVSALTQRLATWISNYMPDGHSAKLIFDIVVYPTFTNNNTPLLSIENAYLNISDINDWQNN